MPLLAGCCSGAALAQAAAPAQGAAPPCLVEQHVEPQRPFVGQQIHYRARIMRREDVDRLSWVQPLAFPNLRAEWLPGRAEDAQLKRDGARYHVREDQRALFAPWRGRHRLPDFQLACGAETIPVPGIVLEVRPLPEHERPADFTGVVGSLSIETRVDRDDVSLGQTVRVSVLARGDANLWNLEVPFEDFENPDVDVFRHEPELNLEPGARLYVRRYFRFDFIPHSPQPFEIPAVQMAYYDASNARYAHARTEPIPIDVGPRTTTPEKPGAGRDANAADEPAASVGAGTIAASLLAGVALLGVVGFGGRSIRMQRAQRAAIDAALQDAGRYRSQRNRAAEAAALARALSRAAADAKSRQRASLEQTVADQLARLEEIRFSRKAAPPPHEEITALIDRLR